MADKGGSFAVGDWLVEPTTNRISTGSDSVYLRPQVMEILVHLAGLQGEVATLESIHDDIWTDRIVSSGAIYNCIAELRQALAQDGRKLNYIETIPKKGYRLTTSVVALPKSGIADQAESSVAIMPLVNRSNDADVDYLCDGIADEILYGLSKVRGLHVFSALSLKDQNLDVRVVGLRFGAELVLSGSLQKIEQKLRVNFRLDSVSSGETKWSGRYDQKMTDIFDLQESVAIQVIGAMSPAFHAGQSSEPLLEQSGTDDLDAFNAFLLGQHVLSRTTLQSYDEAIDLFEQAVAIDPSFARAHYRLYLANYMKRRAFGAGREALDKARVAADNARKHGFRPAVPWVHIQRRLYRETRITTRELALEAIDRLRDRDAEWGSFGYEQLTWVLAGAGFFDATLDFAMRMLDSPAHNFEDSDADEELPYYYAAVGRFDEAIRLWSGLVQKDPARPEFRYQRSILYSRTGQFDYAQNDLDGLVDGSQACMARIFYHFWRDQMDEVRQSHDRLLAIPKIHPSNLLWSYSMIGDIDRAIEYYRISVESTSRSYIDFGNVRASSRGKLPMSVVSKLEQHPGFKELLGKEEIDDAWRTELMERLNAIKDITGIRVQADDNDS